MKSQGPEPGGKRALRARARSVVAAGAAVLQRLCGAAVLALVLVIRFYQRFISAALRPRCRFEPTCSSYAIASLEKHGLAKGLLKSVWRVCRCQPLGRPGYDPP